MHTLGFLLKCPQCGTTNCYCFVHNNKIISIECCNEFCLYQSVNIQEWNTKIFIQNIDPYDKKNWTPDQMKVWKEYHGHSKDPT